MSVPFSKFFIGCIEGSPFGIEAISAQGGRPECPDNNDLNYLIYTDITSVI